MVVFVEGKEAALKSEFSFDYVAENRLFLGRDGYTLNITFPLKACPQNREIFGFAERLDTDKPSDAFECTIIDRNVSIYGALTVVKVNEKELECQFAEGRCQQTATDPFEDVYISDLDLGSGPSSSPSEINPSAAWAANREEVCLPWINKSYATVANNWVKYENGSYKWHDDVKLLSWMPYLIVIAKRICNAIGYKYDFTEWENSRFKSLLCCNVLPANWYKPAYKDIMPRWTVSEFFEKLELFMMCEFNFDHRVGTVEMKFSKAVLDSIQPEVIEDLVDAYSVDISKEDEDNCEYLASKRLAYKECDHELWNYYSCDWYMAGNPIVKSYDTLSDLIEKNKRRETNRGNTVRVSWGEQVGDGYDLRLTTERTLMYAKDVQTYFCFRSIGVEKIGSNPLGDLYSQIYVLQPVNVFGSGMPESEDVSSEEIEFVPPSIVDTYVSADDDMGFMLEMTFSSDDSVSETDSSDTSDRPGGDVFHYDSSVINQPGPAAAIESGEKTKSSGYYDVIYVAFWNGVVPESGKTPYPIIDKVMITQDWKALHYSYDMRLYNSETNFRTELPLINPKQKFKFSWLGTKIPNPRAIFYIRGKKYLCEKITATFTENGMSQLLKGEFYPLLDD